MPEEELMTWFEYQKRNNVELPEDEEYLTLVRDILENESVQSMRNYIQHGQTSCLDHSLHVSYLTYRYCKDHDLDYRAAARAGLLHDLFLYDWHFCRRQVKGYFHGFTHPRKALRNAEEQFHLTARERDMILRHMWPLTPIPPRYKEGYILLWFDKCCSLCETLAWQPGILTLRPRRVRV